MRVPTYLNPGPVEFDGVIEAANESGSGAFVSFPFDVMSLFGVKGRVPVKVLFDEVPYSGSLVKYGRPEHMMPILKDIRDALGKTFGDSVHVRLELDTGERTVELPDDLKTALTDGAQIAAFRALAYTHQREYARWIDEAKRPETRADRIAKTVTMIREGKTRS